MKIVISPSKTLNYKTPLPTSEATQPQFLKQAELINGKLAHKSKKAIKELMSISDSLAALNYQRYKDFSTPFTASNSRPAVYAFAGDVYIGLDAYTLPENKLDLLQESLRILSGMYGLLRPLDLIQPYRLEMGINLRVNGKKNLYGFWGNTLTETLNQELDEDELFLNLASVEYFKAIHPKKLKVPVISPIFKEMNKGELKLISFFAKKARGSMARFVIDKDIKTFEGVLGFDLDGYSFSEKYTEDENEPVFVR